jgi:tetratricopeptide (TPR) repeat protein
MLCRAWLVLCVLGLGCPAVRAASPEEPTGPAGQLWEKGQAAMRAGEPARAIGYYERSLQLDPHFTRSHLSLAAAHLENGNEPAACVHLGLYVATHPEDLVTCSQYVELLLRLKRTEQASVELRRLIAASQEKGDEQLSEMIHWHSRLLDIAESQEDDYGAHLHRGIGLYLLARQRAALADPQGVLPVEALLCRAAGELTEARLLAPSEARPCWYLHLVWSRLGRAGPARRCLAQATAAAGFGGLTRVEQQSLVLAERAHRTQRQGR